MKYSLSCLQASCAPGVLVILAVAALPVDASCVEITDPCDPSYHYYYYDIDYGWDPLPVNGIDSFWSVTGSAEVILKGRGFEPTTSVFLDGGGPTELWDSSTGAGHIITDVAMSGETAVTSRTTIHCSGTSYRLDARDLSDPANPVWIGTAVLADQSHVEVSGRRVIVAAGTRLEIRDIADLGAPQPVGETVLGAPAVAMVNAGEFTHVATTAGVEIVRTDVPESPEVVSVFAWRGELRAVAAATGRIYAAGYADPLYSDPRLLVIDTTRPESPALIGELALTGRPFPLVAREGLILIASGAGIQVMGVDAAGAPSLITTVHTGSNVSDVKLRGDLAYVFTPALPSPSVRRRGELQIYDFQDPRSPVLLSREPVGFRFHSPQQLAVSGNLALITSHWRGLSSGCKYFGGAHLQAFDVENVRDPTLVGSLGVADADYLQSVTVSGSHAYVAHDGSLHVIDLNDPTRPREAGRLLTESGSRWGLEIAVSGDLVAAAQDRSVWLADVSDPAHPAIISELQTPSPAIDPEIVLEIGLEDGLLVVAVWRSSPQPPYLVRTFDVSNPADPTPLSAYELEGWPSKIAVSGGMVYVVDNVDNRRHLLVLDASSQSDLTVLGDTWLEDGGYSSGLALHGEGHVVVAGQALTVIDVQDPRFPVAVGSQPLHDTARQVASTGRTAFVTIRGEVHAFDLTDPTRPRPAGRIFEGTGPNVAALGDHALIADHLLFVVRSNPPLEKVRVESTCEIGFRVPAGMAPGKYDVRVNNTSCPRTGVLPNGWSTSGRSTRVGGSRFDDPTAR